MRNAWPWFLLALPLLLAAIWGSMTSSAVATPESPAAPVGPELRVRRTGIERLAPRPETEPQPASAVRATPELALPELLGLTRVEGWVVDEQGKAMEATVFSTECPSRARTDAEGYFELSFFIDRAMVCDLQANTDHGMLTAVSPTEWVEVAPESRTSVRLLVDSAPQGGIGVAFSLMGEGARVMWLHPYGPAARAGLQEGDVITQVDDLSTEELWDPNLFIQATVGPVGSPVELFLEGEEEGLILYRAQIRGSIEAPEPSDGPDPAAEVTTADTAWREAAPDAAEPLWDSGWVETGWLDGALPGDF